MRAISRVRSWLRAAFHRSRLESDMEAEMTFHLEQYAADLELTGLSKEEARRRALSAFGSIASRRDECREAVGLRIITDLRADLRYAFRGLRAAPAFTLVAVASIGLGLGVNSSLFSLMETALWKTMPVRQPRQLRLFWWASGPKEAMNSAWGDWYTHGGKSTTSSVFSYRVFQDMRRQNTALASIFAFKPINAVTVVTDGGAEMVDAQLVSGNFYEGAGVSTIAGRPITPADDAREAPAVGVISYSYWKRRFGGSSATLGRQILVNQKPVTIVGVNPPQFTGMEVGRTPDLFLPIEQQPVIIPNQWAKQGSLLDDPDYWWVQVMGRLKTPASEASALASLDLVLRQSVMASLPTRGKDLPRLRFRDGARGLDPVSAQSARPLRVMLALTIMVLLIACANVANLLLARATTRQRELSLRLALGAGRWRITRQMLTEGLLLGLLGAGVGIVIGYWSRDIVPALLSTPWDAGALHAEFDTRVMTISLAVALLTAVLFSIAPVSQATRVDVNSALKDGAHSTSSLPRLVAGKALIVFQVALSVLLLVGAGLFVRTLLNLRSQNLGFNPRRILLFTVDPPRTRYSPDRRLALFSELERRMATIPGVSSSTLSSTVLISRSESTTTATPDWRGPRQGTADRVWIDSVGDRFFATMGIPILRGRPIDARDTATSPRVAVVNRRFARELFPGMDALGRTFKTGSESYQIVGICADAHYDQIQTAVPPTFYPAYKQAKDPGYMTFELKTAAGEAGMVRAIRDQVRAVDRDLPVFGIRTQLQQIDDTLTTERLFAALTSGFGLLALVLACIGIYGVMAYGVGRRIAEIGVRMALGAQSGEVLRMILREAAALAGAGLIIGAAAALALTRFIGSMLYGLKPSDPVALGGALAVMLGVALFAGWWPARRAAHLDPMIALRHE
ncbi:MAG TPA: ABC transporter permease [Bryobacteraceae bacterium]|nr:ABC transporter permease [Bryobacteraceae bacterium]